MKQLFDNTEFKERIFTRGIQTDDDVWPILDLITDYWWSFR